MKKPAQIAPTLQTRLFCRARILNCLRSALDSRNYLEVETPLRVRSPGTDPNLEAFSSEGFYLITSPEFHMKRLLARGFSRIYQIGHAFRRDELTKLHNPEFCLLEFYAAGLSLEGMMSELEAIIKETCRKMQVERVHFEQSECALMDSWNRLSVEQAFQQYAGWSPIVKFDEDRFYFDLVDKVDRHLGVGAPTLLYDYPGPLAMLAKKSPENSLIARRFELYVAGVEIANAFEELTDPAEQRQRFEMDLERRRTLGKPLYPLDEVFLDALADMPAASGIAVGVDRLVMLLCGADDVAEVLAFPAGEV